jgi:hypothetical protein
VQNDNRSRLGTVAYYFHCFVLFLFILLLLAEAEGTRRSMASQRQQVRRMGCPSIFVTLNCGHNFTFLGYRDKVILKTAYDNF